MGTPYHTCTVSLYKHSICTVHLCMYNIAGQLCLRWFENMKAAGEMPSWGAGLAKLQEKVCKEREGTQRKELADKQNAGATDMKRVRPG